MTETEEFEFRHRLEQETAVSPQPKPQAATNARIAQEATYKVAAGLPDMLLNTPTHLWNILKSAPAILRGQPLPEQTPTPDFARRGLEKIGLIDPAIQPQGPGQQTIDTLTQGAVGGLLTGGASIPRSLMGAGMGALSAGAAGATNAATDNPALAATAGLLAPTSAARVAGGAGRLRPQAQMLRDEGVSLTPGEALGGVAKRIEDAATSLPILGDSIKAAQRRGHASFDEAALNRSLAPIGQKIPSGLMGNEAVDYAYTKLGDAYENLLPNLKGNLSGPFRQDLANIKAMGQSLPEAQRSQLNTIIDKEVIGQFTPQGLASGETLKDIESLLGKLAIKKASSDNYHENQLGGALKEIQASMRRMVNDANPAYEGELAKINDGYSHFKRAQSAAASVGAQDGVFTPAQLHRAVRAGDKSKDKARFAEGNANMQDLSTAGKSVLSQTVPDSGTPLRAALMYALANPAKAGLLGIPLAIGSLPYTKYGQSLLLQQHPELMEVARRVAPVTTATELSK